MADLQVTLGAAARTAFCSAIADARSSIEAQFLDVNDPAVVDALNTAARRGVAVTLYLEGDRGRYDHVRRHVPDTSHVRDAAAAYTRMFDSRVHIVVEADVRELEHAKAAVVDGKRAFIATANASLTGFADPGEVLVEDDAPRDVSTVRDAIAGRTPQSYDSAAAQAERIVSGPSPHLRSRIASLLDTPRAERIAIEDLSDPAIVEALLRRRASGLRDDVLVKLDSRSPREIYYLSAAGVDVRALPGVDLHEKYIDAGDRIYLGSANLTRNGLDEASEIGIVAAATDFGEGAAALRADFDAMWARAVPIGA